MFEGEYTISLTSMLTHQSSHGIPQSITRFTKHSTLVCVCERERESESERARERERPVPVEVEGGVKLQDTGRALSWLNYEVPPKTHHI